MVDFMSVWPRLFLAPGGMPAALARRGHAFVMGGCSLGDDFVSTGIVAMQQSVPIFAQGCGFGMTVADKQRGLFFRRSSAHLWAAPGLTRAG
jgi:hypothetical protein